MAAPTEQLLTITRLPSYPAEILDCKRSIARFRAAPDARFLAINSTYSELRGVGPAPPARRSCARSRRARPARTWDRGHQDRRGPAARSGVWCPQPRAFGDSA